MNTIKDFKKVLSLIIPSRDRHIKLRKCLDSFIANAYNLEKIEFIVVVDNDDSDTQNIINNEYKELLDKQIIKLLTRERSTNYSDDYYNFAAKQTTGFFIQPIGNDVYCLSKNYDAILYTLALQLETELSVKDFYIVHVGGDMIIHSSIGFCCFPIIQRKSFEEFGYLVAPPTIPAWGADRHLFALYSNTKRKSIFSLEKYIQYFHDSVHSNKDERDESYYRMEKASQAAGDWCTTPSIQEKLRVDINHLNEKIS